MRIIYIGLLLTGIFGLWASGRMFGDIGIAAGTAGVVAILGAVGFFIQTRINKKLSADSDKLDKSLAMLILKLKERSKR